MVLLKQCNTIAGVANRSEQASLINIDVKNAAYDNFISSLKSENTREVYAGVFRKYLNDNNVSIEILLSLPVKDNEQLLVNYILRLRGENKSYSYINLVFSIVKHFYVMNDIRINKEKIRNFVGESKKKNVDRGYKHGGIKKLLEISDLRMKVILSVLASTGMRIRALAPLKIFQVKKIDEYKVYKFIIYENTKEEYYTFCTPECASYIDLYFEFRIRRGEILTDDSYLIREQFDINDLEQIRKHGRRISTGTISNMLRSLVVSTGHWTINHQFTGKERTQVPLIHGFRKFWTTQVINAHINPETREMLLGHKNGLTSSYFRPTEQEMFKEYLKAVDNLTINDENRLRR